jgi:hypothetical protein
MICPLSLSGFVHGFGWVGDGMADGLGVDGIGGRCDGEWEG